jgi:wobble nucleotide-excising tRNase
MLERIHQIRGIGLLHDAVGRAYRLRKATLVYADNGVGKSTLASIFRSCALDNPDLVLRRKTLDGANQPEVLLHFSNGQQSSFANSRWNSARPELLVFDSDFVEQNVYAGGQVTTDHRKRLLQFALGEQAVAAQLEYNQADDAATRAAHEVRDLTNRLSGFHNGITLQEFRELEEARDADAQIDSVNVQIVEAQNIRRIQAKAVPVTVDEPPFEIEPIFSILESSLLNIDLSAEERVRRHLDAHNEQALEKWISDGSSYENGERCPYCNQRLDGIELIQAYRSYFNQEYSDLKQSVAKLVYLISECTADVITERLQAGFSMASAIINGWQEHIDVTAPAFDNEAASHALREIECLLLSLKEAKEANLLEPTGSDDDKRALAEHWASFTSVIRSCNAVISRAVSQICAYKAGLSQLDLEGLHQRISSLNMAKDRYLPEVLRLLSQLDLAIAQQTSANQGKQAKKEALNQIMQSTLDNYKDRINELLRVFGAQFSIPSIDFDYRGGLRSNYSLCMRGSNIDLSGGVPDFKTSLSEGDKRTLAFAFFIASVEADASLSDRIIIIDDPMCSLDLNRRQQTRTILKRVYEQCEQLIVMAHDPHFIRTFRDEIVKSGSPQDVTCIKLKTVSNRYSNFDAIDIDKECEGAYFKCHRTLGDYLDGTAPSSIEVAKSIRPMLEGYLHRRFPGLINKGLLFGQIVTLIQDASQGSPLAHAQNITAELNEINRYAGQYHHGTNPAGDQVQIIDSELRLFVERALKLVHAGIP